MFVRTSQPALTIAPRQTVPAAIGLRLTQGFGGGNQQGNQEERAFTG